MTRPLRAMNLCASITGPFQRKQRGDVVVLIPIMVFSGGTTMPSTVSWCPDDGGLQCDCEDEGCAHLAYVEAERYDNEGRLLIVPNSESVTVDEMEMLVADHQRLREWMLNRVPIVDINTDEMWLKRLEQSSWTNKPN